MVSRTPTGSNGGWRERFILWRNARLADPAFQRWAARFPLTRPIARQRAGKLFDVVAGFVYSQVAAAAIETGLLPFLHARPRSLAEVAAHTGLPIDGAERLVLAAAAIGLTERVGDRWLLGADGAALLGNPGVAQMIAHHRYLYADLADPVALLRQRGGTLANYWAYAEAAPERVAAYSALMATSQPGIASAVLDAYPLARHRHLLDIGGGQGVFAAVALDRTPGLTATVFDLPAVVVRVTDPRLATVGGSFVDDSLPGGADIITLIRVAHDHDDVVVEGLLRHVHAALPPGGTLLLAEPMAETPGSAPIGDAYFGLYLWAMGTGRPRSGARLTAMMTAAGFTRVREHSTAIPSLVRVLTATKT
jgi:demethylspheroidene O-methyltransferase